VRLLLGLGRLRPVIRVVYHVDGKGWYEGLLVTFLLVDRRVQDRIIMLLLVRVVLNGRLARGHDGVRFTTLFLTLAEDGDIATSSQAVVM
jgi:hypothetical protein